jgi:peptidoglycan/LPS O-acetylase OafA/YrhL
MTTRGADHDGRLSEPFRPDLEGLRGVAILLVLLFHAGLPWLGGGFVGVDVFFVLSGFLITGLLVREITQSGRIDFRAFYARRARRILPAALVVVVATLAASALVLDPLDLSHVAGDALAAALSVANVRFAASAMDYFDSSSLPSPLLHYWSLGVEEQFYVLWPTLLFLGTRSRWPRLGAAITLLAVIIASFGASLFLTDAAAPWAFYSLPARAWQLALGGLLALVALPNIRIVRWPLALLAWGGLTAIAFTALALDPATPYPGWAALVPSLGAAAIILGGHRRRAVGVLLATRPLRFLGRISFSLYLVHWPILVLPAALLAPGDSLSDAARAGLAIVSVGAAVALHRLIEEPFHHGRRLGLSPGRVLAFAGSAVVVVSLVGLAVGSNAVRVLDASDSGVVSLSDAGAAAASTDDRTQVSTSDEGGAPVGPESDRSAATHQPRASATAPAPRASRPQRTGPVPLPLGVRPSIADAPGDRELLVTDGCLLGYAGITPPDCEFGDRSGSRTVALVGDSHASQWFPALDLLATAHHWRLVTFTKLSCRFIDLPMFSRVLKREYTECEAWRGRVVDRLVGLRPDLTIVAAARGPEMMNKADTNPTRQGLAMARLLAPVGGKFAILVDTPESLVDVPACISGHVSDLRPCQTPRGTALGWEHLLLERAAADALGGTVVDLTNAICPSDPCPVVVNRMIVYRDDHHMTATFAASLADRLDADLPRLD